MGRHGGGSSGGGGGSGGGGRSGGGSSRGGSRSSSTPFIGCYKRSYFDRLGRRHHYYTTDQNFGVSLNYSISTFFAMSFLLLSAVLVLFVITVSTFFFGERVDGDSSNIYIIDEAQILTEPQKEDILSLFDEVYAKSGMPVALVTDTFDWRERYDSIEACSEAYYYEATLDEDAMLVFFAVDSKGQYKDWEFDIYCGDDTRKCLSDPAFYNLVENVRRASYAHNIGEALEFAFRKAMPSMAQFGLRWGVGALVFGILLYPTTLLIFGLILFVIISSYRSSKDACNYFKEHPEKLSNSKMSESDVELEKRCISDNG